MEHPAHLTGHQTAGVGVALKHGAAQAAQGELFQLHLVSARLFLTDVLPAHAVLEHPYGGSPDASGDDGIAVPGLEKRRFVVGVNGAFLAHQQAGAHLNAAGAQRQRGGHLPSVRNAARCNDRKVHRVHHLGNQRHGGHFSHMAAALGALRDQRIGARFFQMPGQKGGGHHGNHRDARLLPLGQILSGIACTGGYHPDTLLHHDLGKGVRLGMHEHDVHAKGLVGPFTTAADVGPQLLGVHAAGTDQAQRARVGTGGGKLAGGNVGHAALNNGVSGTQKFVQKFHCSAPLYCSSIPAQVRPPPKPTHDTVWPGIRSPDSAISLSATGMLAALVLPCRSMFL